MIELILESESFEKEIGGSTFILKRMSFADSYLISKELEGIPADDQFRAQRATLRVCLIGWRNVIAGDNADVPFDKGLIDRLPFITADALVKAIEDESARDQEKNSPSAPN